jgi:hypothetical protein
MTMRLRMMTALAALALATSAASAQDADAPSFAKGSVWDYASIRTKDGHFDDYMKWLSTEWKAQQDALRKAGYVSSYKVMVVADPREGEPDIILATEYPNMAAFDRSVSEEYAFAKKTFGPLAKASKEQADRATIRTVMGDMMLREAILK